MSEKLKRQVHHAGTSINRSLGFAPEFRVKVDRDCIENACRGNGNKCMVAKAVKKAHPELSRIAVDIQSIRASNEKKSERYIWLTPPSIQRMIVDFDAGKDITPFNTTLIGGQTIHIEKRAKKKRPSKIVKIKTSRSRSGKTNRPRIIGGHEPPRAIGATRRFGMRGIPINQAA